MPLGKIEYDFKILEKYLYNLDAIGQKLSSNKRNVFMARNLRNQFFEKEYFFRQIKYCPKKGGEYSVNAARERVVTVAKYTRFSM